MWWGWACAVVGTAGALPQIIRLLRSGTSAGVSLFMWQLNVGVGIGWTAHGLATGHLNVTVPNALVTSLAAATLVLIQRDRGLGFAQVWGLGLGVGALAIGLELLAPPELFGAMITIPLLSGLIGQARDLVRAPDLAGVSPGFLWLFFVIQAMWGVWGQAAGDISIIITSHAAAVLALVNIGLYLVRRRRVTISDAVPSGVAS